MGHHITGCWKIFGGTTNVGLTNTSTKGIYDTANSGDGSFVPHMIRMDAPGHFAVFVQAASSGTIAVSVKCVTNHEDVIANAVVPDGMPDIIDLSDNTMHHIGFAPPVTPFMAIRVTGTGANDTSTRVKLWLVEWET